ncbi:MAG: hypothetical protein JW797_05695 [Bradymonadales bacterium]|nr:hypothetical protein [Bradymonadales bacterium]
MTDRTKRWGWWILPAGLLLLWSATANSQEAVIPAEAGSGQGEAAVRQTAGYQRGFFLRSVDQPFELRIQGRMQGRYTHLLTDGAPDELAFSLPRIRLVLAGHMFTEALRYRFQADFGGGAVTLKDAFLDYTVVSEWLELRVGQWKRPFSRQQINSSGRLELVDRAITDRFFGAGRDIGLAIHNGYESSPTLEYALGLFNGTGDRSRLSGAVQVDPASGIGQIVNGSYSNVPDRMHPALVFRVGYNHGGIRGYSEADLEGSAFRFALGASGLVDLDADEDGSSGVMGEVDFVLKASGFASTGGFFLSSTQSGEGFVDQSFDALGFTLQAGYVVAGRIQPVLRYSHIDPDGPDNRQQELLGGLSVYLFGHNVKWQTDGGALVNQVSGGSSTNYLLRSQIQLAF